MVNSTPISTSTAAGATDAGTIAAGRAAAPISAGDDQDRRAPVGYVSPGRVGVGELVDGLDRGQIGASFRPVAHLATGALVGWEAVARWDHPSRGVLRPDAFVRLAEENRLLPRVEVAVLDAALRTLAAADDPSRSRPTISVPLSVSTLLTGDAAGWIASSLEASGLAPSRLFVEVGGHVPAHELEPLGRELEQLRDHGVRIALTDIACADSFHRLRVLPVDRIHLGNCCTAGLVRSREQAIVRSLLSLARDLAVDVVADGVTTDHDDRMLRRLGCPLGSGPRIGEYVPHLASPVHHDVAPRTRRTYPVPANEVARLGALYESGLLDSGREQVFDDIAAEASRVCGAPVGMVTLVDVDRVFFKAVHGPVRRPTDGAAATHATSPGARGGSDPSNEVDRRVAFCAHTICEPVPLVVHDTLLDERFAHLPSVVEAPYHRFYAGVPLTSSDGVTFGTVCVFDQRPRHLDDDQLAALRRLASHAAAHVELRARLHQLDRATQSIASAERAVDELRRLVTIGTELPAWLEPGH